MVLTCEHLTQEACEIAGKIAGIRSEVQPFNCRQCLACQSPKQRNATTLTLAIAARAKAGLTVSPLLAKEVALLNPGGPEFEAKRKAVYHQCWRSLHGFAFSPLQWLPDEAKRWYFGHWKESIPATDCNCLKNFDELEKITPPTFRSRREFFWWTVDIHQKVRRKLGQSPWPLTDIQNLYDLKRLENEAR